MVIPLYNKISIMKSLEVRVQKAAFIVPRWSIGAAVTGGQLSSPVYYVGQVNVIVRMSGRITT